MGTATTRYPNLPFVCLILGAGYDAEELHCDIFAKLDLLPIIIRKPFMKWEPNLSDAGTLPFPFGCPTRRRGIGYNHGRTKFSCYYACLDDPQRKMTTAD
ncbi:MAG: hypothetical protein JSV50_17825 [Desulfobacteraceae bacterium]|nr:MAG: hypothetical protein JSV50_17825 [Desulfobacteraceae bacterium]